ncbi:MAG: Ig-like domain-containing protein, partial [Porphyromonadaceae bacterium]|nr:Ig-like domain-containing protein [Porphyromonadaceae bacterium]
MNSSIRRVLSFSILVLTCFAFSSCNKDDKATTITVSPEKVTVNVGETVKVLAIIEPETQGPATWKSLNESIAKVSDGVITGVSKGETQVEAITKDGSKATVMVTVNEAPVGDLSISPNPLRVNEGEDLKVSVNGLPVGVQADFKVANSSVASVSKDGILHGVEEGATELTVSAKGKTASVKVLVSSKDLISFVDPVFKECVVKGLLTEDGAVLGCIDYNGDGEISKKEAARLTRKENTLALFDIIEIEDGVEKSRRSLQSTEDLKWFPNAMALMVRGCKTLKKIDFDKLPKLTNIMLSDLPAVSKLDLTTIPHLDGAYISWVESSSLDFSSCR